MTLRGIIDLGSNTVRLVVYDVKEIEKEERKQLKKAGAELRATRNKLFREVLNEKKTAGLSSYVADGIFSRDGIECAVEVLDHHLNTAKNIGCDSVHIFATAVIRNCDNSKEASKRISKAIDAPIDVISDEEEAHLGFVGASCDRIIKEGTLIDIGGGSTELTSIRSGEDFRSVSIPQGSVSSYAASVSMILPNDDECHAIASAFRRNLADADGVADYHAERLYGIGGSVRAIDKLYAGAFSGDRRLRVMEPHQIDALGNLLRTQPSTFAHAATKAVPERLHTIVPGMVIAQTLMAELGAKSLSICKYGLREGYLLERVLGI